MTPVRGVAVLGSTGSIGKSTLAVIAEHPDRFRVTSLGAHRNWQTVVEQAKTFEPDTVVLVDADAAERARIALRESGSRSKVESGAAALAAAVADSGVQIVMAAIVGAAGLLPTL
ncbi:MAG TPA: 1-deoxy-D-xylulose-5-phosphate reductoisomerase, partial [Steroidobacteraceae bacterium]|nr:1-deoxy-D-xylulose-5-phosphate reductoisomerase [Steroidobacteraceae bacterium]